MTDIAALKKIWMNDPEFAGEYEALSEEFAVAHALIKARTAAGMTQADVAERMQVSQARIAKLESGSNVSITSLKRYAAATGTKLNISLDRPGAAFDGGNHFRLDAVLGAFGQFFHAISDSGAGLLQLRVDPKFGEDAAGKLPWIKWTFWTYADGKKGGHYDPRYRNRIQE